MLVSGLLRASQCLGQQLEECLSRTHFGDELDFIIKRTINPRSNILLGYSHFWRGDKILAPRDADFLYVQWELNF